MCPLFSADVYFERFQNLYNTGVSQRSGVPRRPCDTVSIQAVVSTRAAVHDGAARGQGLDQAASGVGRVEIERNTVRRFGANGVAHSILVLVCTRIELIRAGRASEPSCQVAPVEVCVHWSR